jgi:hypothetical protein
MSMFIGACDREVTRLLLSDDKSATQKCHRQQMLSAVKNSRTMESSEVLSSS